MAETTHRMVYRRARPSRVALLLPDSGRSWRGIIRHALSSLSVTWGGSGDILVPTDRPGHPHPAFRRILQAFDPDYIGAYRATKQEFIRADPEAYPRWRETQADKDTAGEEDLRARFEAAVAGTFGWWGADNSVAEVSDWTAPYAQNSGYFPTANLGQPVSHPLVAISKFPGQLKEAMDLDLSALDPDLDLMVRLRVGALDGVKLEGGAEVRTLVAEERDELALSELALLGEVEHRPDGDSHIRHIEELQSFTVPLTQHVDARSPFTRSKHGLTGFAFTPRNTWVVVLGDVCEDFCLALACDRMMTIATWLPVRLIAEPNFLLRLAHLRTRLTANQAYGWRIVFTSASLDPEALRAAWLTATGQDEAAAGGWSEAIPIEELDLSRPRSLSGPDFAVGESSVCYADDDGTVDVATAMPTPIIPVVRDVPDATQVRWEVDLDIWGLSIPPRRAIGVDQLLARLDERERIAIRTGRAGPTYHSHEIAGFSMVGQILEQHLTRPSVRVPSARPVLDALAAAAELEIRPSQTGRLNGLLIDIWGGLDRLAADLDGRVWGLLGALAPAKPQRNGPGTDCVWINGVNYVSTTDAVSLLGCDEDHLEEARAELDRLVRIGALRRGLILRCARCHWLEWYALEVLGQKFQCSRCRHTNDLEQARWNEPVIEPSWFYDLDHAIREALRLNGRIPLLALDRLRQRTRRSFTYAVDFEVWEPGSKPGHLPEIDFAAVWDTGVLVLGEAKKNSTLGDGAKGKEKLERTLRVAQQLRADTICFATGAASWTDATKHAIEDALAGELLAPLYLEGIGRGVPGPDPSFTITQS